MRYFTPFLLFAFSLFAQQPDVARGPIAFAAAVRDTAIWVGTGGPNGAVTWRLTYHVDGTLFTAAQVAIQGANAPNAAGCATAAYATIATANADVVESANPSVSAAQGNVAVKSFYPCIAMTVTAVTGANGTVTASIAGWKGGFGFPTTIVPGGTQDVNVKQVAGTNVPSAGIAGTLPVGGTVATNGLLSAETFPQLVAGEDYGGTPHIQVPKVDSSGNMYMNVNQVGGVTPDICTLKAVIASPAIGITLLVAHSGTTTIRVCKWSFTTDNLTTAQLFTGTTTKTSCDGAVVNETHVYTGAGGGVFGIIEDYASPLLTTAGKDLCIGLGAGVTTSGGVTIEYSQR